MFSLWLCSGLVGVMLGLDKEFFSNQELRTPTVMKEFKAYTNSKDFFIDVENYWGDRIFFRNYYISLHHFLQFDEMLAPFNGNSKHLTGKEKWIFLGNFFNQVIDYTINLNHFSSSDVEQKIKRLKKIQTIVKDYNIPYVMIVTPNKHSIYEEYLPNRLKIKSNFRFADAVLQKAQEQQLYLSFPKKVLLKEKILATMQGKRLYLTDDSHWNEYGALLAFKEAWGILRTQGDFPDISHALTTKQIEKKHNGDIIKLGKYSAKYRDPVTYQYVLDEETKKNIIKKKHILAVGDSFTRKLLLPYSFAFEEITFFHWNTMTLEKLEELIKDLKPDAVVYQVVERSFLREGILK